MAEEKKEIPQLRSEDIGQTKNKSKEISSSFKKKKA